MGFSRAMSSETVMLVFAIVLVVWTALVGKVTSQKDPHCVKDRTTFVHLFEWKWTDITRECQDFLGPNGYCGVQVSPPNEHRIVRDPPYPWYQRYQPVSYKLTSRSGTEEEFANMVKKCNDVGVRIYVDAVINHMTGGGCGKGTAGTSWDANLLLYPGVPYDPKDFNCCHCNNCTSPSCDIENYQDVNQVRNCRLLELRDLKLSKSSVQQKIWKYLNKLIAYGVAGFRIDAAKHMWPSDIKNILNNLEDLNTEWFPPRSRPFIFQEVIALGGEPIKATDYVSMGKVTEFKYGKELSEVIRKVHGQKMTYLQNFGEGWAMIPDQDAVVFIDNHDNQRGHGAYAEGGVLTFYEPKKYKMGTAFMLSFPYGFPKVMSSYRWKRHFNGQRDLNAWMGPPSDGEGNTIDVSVNSDNTCNDGWVCEHRWRQIYNMVKFRNACHGLPIQNWWSNGGNQIAFSRGNKCFIAFNNENWDMNMELQTGLSEGQYCDIASGTLKGESCTGTVITVNENGIARIMISSHAEDSFIAIMKGFKLQMGQVSHLSM